jgi:hypothetical protein
MITTRMVCLWTKPYKTYIPKCSILQRATIALWKPIFTKSGGGNGLGRIRHTKIVELSILHMLFRERGTLSIGLSGDLPPDIAMDRRHGVIRRRLVNDAAAHDGGAPMREIDRHG